MTTQEALDALNEILGQCYIFLKIKYYGMAQDAIAVLKSAVEERDALKADLERARPLLEAVMGDGKAYIEAPHPLVIDAWAVCVLEFAVDYKEANETKAGEDKAGKLSGGLTTAPEAETSPGPTKPGTMRVKYTTVCPRCGLVTEHNDIIDPEDGVAFSK